MGMIANVLDLLFGPRNVVRETAEIFRENAEAGAQRDAQTRTQAMTQYGAEFAVPRKGRFDRFMDGLNRLPRPALAFGTLGLFVAAMVDPLWFAARMQGIALVPEPLWWLLGVIVSFYFGARHQMKAQEFQRGIAATVALAPQVIDNIATLERLRAESPGVAGTGPDAELGRNTVRPDVNRALMDWKAGRGR